MAELIQGEQLPIGITLKLGNTPFTPSNCDDVRIVIGGIEKSYTGGGVTYNASTQKWEFFVTDEQTWAMIPQTTWQAEITVGQNKLRTQVNKIFVGQSVLELED